MQRKKIFGCNDRKCANATKKICWFNEKKFADAAKKNESKLNDYLISQNDYLILWWSDFDDLNLLLKYYLNDYLISQIDNLILNKIKN